LRQIKNFQLPAWMRQFDALAGVAKRKETGERGQKQILDRQGAELQRRA
jgi:hypothetical protein